MKNRKLIYFIILITVSFLILSSNGCATTPTKLDENFYNTIQKIGTEVDSIYFFKLPNGISVYLYNQPKNETDYESSKFYNSTWISFVFDNLAVSMQNLPAGTQYELADILYYIPGKKYNSDDFDELYNKGYIETLNYQMNEDHYTITIAGSPTHFNSILTDIPADILNKDIPKNLDYKEIAKGYSDFLKKKAYDTEWLVYRMAEENAFKNTAYSHLLDSSSSYSLISSVSVSKLYSRLIQPKNLTIIIKSAKLNPQAAANIIWEKFSFLKNNNNSEKEFDVNSFFALNKENQNKNNFHYFTSKDVKNSLIAGYFSGPLLNSEEFPAFVAALNIFSKKLFINVRIKNNGAYQIDAFPYFLKQSWGNILYKTSDITLSMEKIRQTILDLKKDGITDDDLLGFKNFTFTIYYLYQSYGKSKFNLFYNSIVTFEDNYEKFYIKYLDTYQNLTKQDVELSIKKYFDCFYWGLVVPDESLVNNLPKDLFFFNP